jgi:hypothetical protein
MANFSRLTKNPILFAAFTFIIGALVGSGGIWSYLNHRVNVERQKTDRLLVSLNIRDKIDTMLVEIANLYENQEEIIGINEKGVFSEKLRFKIDDIKALEAQLADIEHREPRRFQWDFIPPAPTILEFGPCNVDSSSMH